MAGRPPKQAKNKKSKTTTIVKVNNLNFSSPRWSIQHTLAIVHIYCKLQSNLSILPEYKLLMLGFLFFLIPLLLCQEISLSARIYLLSRTLVSSNNYTPLLYLHFPNWVLNGLNLISFFFSDCPSSSKAEGSLFFRVSVYLFLTLYYECGCST